MSADEYQNRDTVEKNSLDLLRSECGKHLRAGEILRYIITDYYQKHSKIRSIPVQLINEEGGATIYDTRRYVELLIEVCNSVTKPFGYSCSMPKRDYSIMRMSAKSIRNATLDQLNLTSLLLLSLLL